jgi:hypothetical protein
MSLPKLLAVCIVLLFLACTDVPKPLLKDLQPYSYEFPGASQDTLFSAALVVLKAQGYDIESSNKYDWTIRTWDLRLPLGDNDCNCATDAGIVYYNMKNTTTDVVLTRDTATGSTAFPKGRLKTIFSRKSTPACKGDFKLQKEPAALLCSTQHSPSRAISGLVHHDFYGSFVSGHLLSNDIIVFDELADLVLRVCRRIEIVGGEPCGIELVSETYLGI